MRILFEPRTNAFSVEVMLAGEEEDFLSFPIYGDANGTHVVFLLFIDSLGVELLDELLFDTKLCSQLILEVFVVDSFEGFV